MSIASNAVPAAITQIDARSACGFTAQPGILALFGSGVHATARHVVLPKSMIKDRKRVTSLTPANSPCRSFYTPGSGPALRQAPGSLHYKQPPAPFHLTAANLTA